MATKYKSKFTGEQIDNSVETIVSNTATNGQVLTANGTGGATWQDAKGTEVVANPSLAGTESDLTGLEVAGTKYKVPTGAGTEVIANPSLAGTESDLTGLEVAGTKYKVPTGGGTEVVANPTAEATEELTKLQVGSSVYSIPTGNALVKPETPPSAIELVGIDTNGNQVRIQVDTNDFEIDGTTSPYILKKRLEQPLTLTFDEYFTDNVTFNGKTVTSPFNLSESGTIVITNTAKPIVVINDIKYSQATTISLNNVSINVVASGQGFLPAPYDITITFTK